MKQFKDAKGREWQIEVNAASVELVSDLVGVSLTGLLACGDVERYCDFLDHPKQFSETLWLLVQKQAESKSVARDDFKAAINGDAREDATAALQEEIICFFPRSKREGIRTTLRTLQEMGQALHAKGVQKIQAIDVDKESQKILRQLEEKFGEKSCAAPATSASTPAPTNGVISS